MQKAILAIAFRIRPHARTLWATIACACTLGACEQPLREELIVSPRILAMRAELAQAWLQVDGPEEVSMMRSEFMPFDRVRIRPYLVSPDGEVAPETWPSLLLICLGRQAECTPNANGWRDLDALPQCSTVVPIDLAQLAAYEPATTPCVVESTPPNLPEFAVPFAGEWSYDFLQVFWIGGPPQGPTPRECARQAFFSATPIDSKCLLMRAILFGPDLIESDFIVGADENSLPTLRLLREREDGTKSPALGQRWELTSLTLTQRRPGSAPNVMPLSLPLAAKIDVQEGDSVDFWPSFSERRRDDRFSAATYASLRSFEDLPFGLRMYTTYGAVGVNDKSERQPPMWTVERSYGDDQLSGERLAHVFLVVGESAWVTVPATILARP
jgi:hypothetical protein